MALILAFRAPAAHPSASPQTQDSKLVSAELIFFPGVRYERHAPEQDPAPVAKGRRARRSSQRELIDMMD